MFYVDTHTHLYLSAFDTDRNETIRRAIGNGVKYMLLPNIDSSSIEPMHKLCYSFPENCFPMMGLHPTSVKENWEDELKLVTDKLKTGKYYAVGEIGLDFYWDLTYRKEQEIVFRKQIQLAIELGLPLVIHSRKSMDEIILMVREMKTPDLTGIFHCFSGSPEQAARIVDMGFKLGIGGVVTFKNSKLASTIQGIGIGHLVLETDAPFISPVPYRGKRNESAYLPIIATHVAQACGVTVEEVAEITSKTALDIFKTLPEPKN